jgi:hypothetical protein
MSTEICYSKGVILLHDNARPHSAVATVESVSSNLNFPTSLPPPHNPDLTPSDCQISGSLKEAFHELKYASDGRLKDAVGTWLQTQPKNVFVDGIRRYVKRYKLCVETKGVDLEK